MEGHAIVTNAGDLPSKKVIHAVGPRWRGGGYGEENIIYDCVFNHILRIAVEENFRSIAIPAISSGVFGVPMEVSTSTITEAIKDFLDDQDTTKGVLTEIHLIDNRKDGGQAFANAMRKRFKITRKGEYRKQKNVQTFNLSRAGKYLSFFPLKHLITETRHLILLSLFHFY